MNTSFRNLCYSLAYNRDVTTPRVNEDCKRAKKMGEKRATRNEMKRLIKKSPRKKYKESEPVKHVYNSFKRLYSVGKTN